MTPGITKRVVNLHDVFMYVAIARKHIRLMTWLIGFTLTCGLTYYVYARPVYWSKSLVKMDYYPQLMSGEKVFNDAGRIRAVIKELTAPHIVERTARSLGLPASWRQIQLKYIKKTSVRQNSEKNLEIEVWPTSPTLAAQWPEALVKEFLAYRKEKWQRERDEVFATYTKELE